MKFQSPSCRGFFLNRIVKEHYRPAIAGGISSDQVSASEKSNVRATWR